MVQELTVEIVCIGTELLRGLTQDTNSHWLAKESSFLGCEMRQITVVPDDVNLMLEAFRSVVNRGTDVLMTSGGLGPTADDMTVAVMAQFLGCKVVVDEDLVRLQMERRGIKERKDVQGGALAMSKRPESAVAHPNPVGSAPCIQAKSGGTTIFMMPGPPREVQGVFEAHVKPFVQKASPFKTARQRVIVNMPESQVGPLLVQVMKTYSGTYLKGAIATSQRIGETWFLPIDIVSRGETLERASAMLVQTVELFEQLVHQQGRQFIDPESLPAVSH
ncbi:MAG: competence/damage-inducible protein A [Dehalococcoidia bacterium]|nr:competence/damage-inducible protein A [Dehalococcoidia bacterium]